MSNEPVDHRAPEPDLAQARRNAIKAHAVVIKLKEMGLPQGLDEDLASLSTDLGDLWAANMRLTEQLDLFLSAPSDWGEIGDRMADLKAGIDHMAWHVDSIRGPLDRIAAFAYESSDQSGEGD